MNNVYDIYEHDRAKNNQRSWVLDNWVLIVLGLAILGKLFGIIRVPWIVILTPMIIWWGIVWYCFDFLAKTI